MAFVDDVERLGRAVEAGEMTRAAGRQALITAAPGSLTELGAEDLLSNWEKARSLYSAAFASAAAGLDRCWGLT